MGNQCWQQKWIPFESVSFYLIALKLFLTGLLLPGACLFTDFSDTLIFRKYTSFFLESYYVSPFCSTVFCLAWVCLVWVLICFCWDFFLLAFRGSLSIHKVLSVLSKQIFLLFSLHIYVASAHSICRCLYVTRRRLLPCQFSTL